MQTFTLPGLKLFAAPHAVGASEILLGTVHGPEEAEAMFYHVSEYYLRQGRLARDEPLRAALEAGPFPLAVVVAEKVKAAPAVALVKARLSPKEGEALHVENKTGLDLAITVTGMEGDAARTITITLPRAPDTAEKIRSGGFAPAGPQDKTSAQASQFSTLPPIPEGDRFKDETKFRLLGWAGGSKLYECWEGAIHAYARAARAVGGVDLSGLQVIPADNPRSEGWNAALDHVQSMLSAQAPVVAAPVGDGDERALDPIRELIALHAEELDQNDYAYFELARTRRTDWMAWICTNLRDDDPDRNVLAKGQGDTPEEACAAAVADYKARAALTQQKG